MYTPQFSDVSCVSVRRLAWALQINMGAAVSRMVSALPSIVNSAQVCAACKDNTKCGLCIFSGKISASPAGLEL